MKSFEEKLEEIVKRTFYVRSDGLALNPPEAIQAILHLLDEEMPEEEMATEEFMYEEGWNSYRTELRKRIGLRLVLIK